MSYMKKIILAATLSFMFLGSGCGDTNTAKPVEQVPAKETITEEQRIANEKAAEEKARAAEELKRKWLEEQEKQKQWDLEMEEVNARAVQRNQEETERQRQEREDERAIYERSQQVSKERDDIIRRTNNLFGGGDHLVTVTGIERKDIYFELDVGTDDLETAREIAVGAVYDVLEHFYDYDVNFVQVITMNRRTPLGLVNWWSDSGFEYLGGLK